MGGRARIVLLMSVVIWTLVAAETMGAVLITSVLVMRDLLGSSVRIKNVPIIAQGMETVTSRVAFASVYLDLLAVTVLTLCLAQMTAQVKSKVYVFQQSEFLSYMFCLSASLAFPLIIVFSDISTILAY